MGMNIVTVYADKSNVNLALEDVDLRCQVIVVERFVCDVRVLPAQERRLLDALNNRRLRWEQA